MLSTLSAGDVSAVRTQIFDMIGAAADRRDIHDEAPLTLFRRLAADALKAGFAKAKNGFEKWLARALCAIVGEPVGLDVHDPS